MRSFEMKRWCLAGSAMTLGLLLSGCGGGGVGSTPAPTYTKLADLTGNRSFKSAGIRLTVGSNQPFSFSSQKYGAGVRIDYTASSDSYTLTAPDGTTDTFSSSTNTPPPGLTTPPSDQTILYNSAGSSFAIAAPSVNGVALSYTAVGAWSRIQNNVLSAYVAVSGVPTVASDMPRTGTATYQTSIAGSVFESGSAQVLDTAASSATFSANFGAGTVATTLHLVGRAPSPTFASAGTPSSPDFGSYSGSGTIASGSPGFSGTLASTASSAVVANGEFSGAFFGPQAKEMGYGWYVNGGVLNGQGVVVGTK
jgi:hypothetical protein